MTLPRKMLLSKDRTKILTPPVGQVISLRNEEVETDKFVLGNPITYPNGTAEVILTIQKDHTMILSLEIVYLNYTAKVSMSTAGLEIIRGLEFTPFRPEPRLIALGARPTEVRIFIDIGSIEVFGDNGEWAGTARIPGTEKFSSLRLTGDLDAVVSARVWALKPAHMLGRYVP
ncbi:hypothetical protein DdX_14697 [Ditylenchus destructor]|uniref:Glycosyl hydrolase family 32 C-terminal domain-containing protein n=1 Tax=Ditylenchus destructor TaxID=166010 RepID=A0AAD4QVE3_9BILA|nr:hypothetical protein DdX_14697 [Ditylenchus destructor]